MGFAAPYPRLLFISNGSELDAIVTKYHTLFIATSNQNVLAFQNVVYRKSFKTEVSFPANLIPQNVHIHYFSRMKTNYIQKYTNLHFFHR